MSSSRPSPYQVVARRPTNSESADVARAQKESRADKPIFEYIMHVIHEDEQQARVKPDLNAVDAHWGNYQYWLGAIGDEDADAARDAAIRARRSGRDLRRVSCASQYICSTHHCNG